TGCSLRDVLVNNVTGTGVHCGPFSWIGDFQRVNARNCTTGFELASDNNRYNLVQCDANNCDTGFKIGAGSGSAQLGIQLFGGRAENVDVGVLVDAPSRVVGIFGMYIE